MRYSVIEVPSERDAGFGRALDSAVEALRAGGILVHPTSTLYGIGAAATGTLDREICRLKGRKLAHPLIRLAGSVRAIRQLCPAVGWTKRCERLAEAVWPGPLTLVIRSGSPSGMAVRVDGHGVTLELLDRFGGLISSTSVNRSGSAAARSPAEVRRALDAIPDSKVGVAFLDAGPLEDSGASTILSLLDGSPRILRRGAVGADRIAAVLQEEVVV